jgi:hypothetical protein
MSRRRLKASCFEADIFALEGDKKPRVLKADNWVARRSFGTSLCPQPQPTLILQFRVKLLHVR